MGGGRGRGIEGREVEDRGRDGREGEDEKLLKNKKSIKKIHQK